MADITWPTDEGVDFDPEGFDEAIEFNVELTVARSGKVSTQSLPGARFRCVMQFKDTSVSRLVARRRLHALFARMRGGADRLLLWNLLTPEPLGSMRGTVTVAATLAAGASTVQITGGRAGPNLLTSSGFEIDSNSDGLADGWTTYTNGTVSGGVPDGLVAGNGSPFAQRMYAANIGASIADRFGVRYTANVAVVAGAGYTLAADVLGSAATMQSNILVDWYTAGNAFISGSDSPAAMPTSWARRVCVATAPLTAAYAKLYLWMQASPSGLPVAVQFDNVQFEQSAAATAYSGLPTLLRGDFIGVGDQRVMVVADATANDAGAVTVSFQPAHRAGAASAAAVTLVRPTTRYVVTSPVVQMPVRGKVLPGFAVEMVEE